MGQYSTILAFILVTIFTFPHHSHSSNILIWGAVSSKSVRLSMTPFIEALAEKGHNVTFIAVMEDKDADEYKRAKVNVFIPTKWRDAMGAWENEDVNFYNIRKTFYGVPKSWYDFRPMGTAACEHLYSDPQFINWVKTSPKYELIVVELAMINECAYGLVQFFNSKLAIYSTTSVIPGYADAFGLPDETSSISDITWGFPPNMSFIQRLVNAFSTIIFTYTKEYSYFPKLEAVTRKGWKALGRNGEDVASFVETEKNASLILLTSHFTLDYPRSLPPNVVPVGGVVVTKNKKPLSKDMETFLESATEGFIYINFGTIVQFQNFEYSVQVNFIKVLEHFSKIKFLWSTPVKISVELPDNVLVSTWTPQQTVLSHPNIKGFITHSGMGATTEAIHFSVPMVCIPVLAEQDHNAQVIASRNGCIKLEIVGLKQEPLQNAISEILHNDKYRIAINKLSNAFKDRPTPPLDNAIWWIEYILRHDNTEFLVSPSLHKSWWKRRQIDVWITAVLLLLAAFLIPVYIIFAVLKGIFCKGKANSEINGRRDSKLKRN